MTDLKQITLYTAKQCPYAHRVEIALAEANAKHTRFEIDLRDKPEWYAPQVNPASKVPAVAYGGPDVPADQPSPESIKIPESLVLVEFVADLFPESGILPKDPVLRAKARLFIDAVSNKFNPALFQVTINGADPEVLVQAFEHIQALLPAEGFAVGEFSIADIAIAPFFGRLDLGLTNDLGAWPEGQGNGQKILSLLQQPKLARINEYSKAVRSRPSYVSTWHPEWTLEKSKVRYKELREKKYGA